jgi:hypothetical protein
MTEFNWDEILRWKLLSGSHKFPGPDGGTCINEAAIVAAGFAYRRVQGVADLPPCFCPVLGEFLIVLNDRLDEAPRQALVRYVTRLSGTRDREEVMVQRANVAADAAGINSVFDGAGAIAVASRAAQRLANLGVAPIETINAMFAIGNQAKAPDIALVCERMEKIREKVTA